MQQLETPLSIAERAVISAALAYIEAVDASMSAPGWRELRKVQAARAAAHLELYNAVEALRLVSP